MDDAQLYRGRFDQVGDRKLNSVRVFVSSTFTDTTEERNGLIEHVYPRLREYCQTKYNIQFQYSDMRWGIQSIAANSHATVDMCLQELDTCCRLSMATNCVVLLSHRYGSRFAPACIPSHVYQAFERCLAPYPEETRVLTDMYQSDENYLDKRYFLRPIDDEQQWAQREKKLQRVLRKAADLAFEQKLISKEEQSEFHISVTAQEIYRALSNNKGKARRLLCFLREINDIDALDSKFHETENVAETQKLLDTVKNDLRQSLDSADVYSYQVHWKDDSSRKKYLSQFFDDFYRALAAQVDHHLKIHENRREDQLYNQVLEHAIQTNLLVQRFFPRPDVFEQIKAYVTSTSNHPCVLLGESGTGKSSIMAKLVREIPQWYSQPNSVSVIIRFLGATPSSSDLRRPLISIIEQICTLYRLERPADFVNVRECLASTLAQVPQNEHLVLLLDSIDQLQTVDLKDLSVWLPTQISSSNIRCIISTIPEIEIERVTFRIHEQLRTIFTDALVEIQVKPFDGSTAEEVLRSWLEQDRRCLTAVQHEWLKPKLALAQRLTPLFLSLVYDQTLAWHSYDQTPDKAFLAVKNTTNAIGYLYNQLGIKHGQVLFKSAMRYLQLSGGLSELEMEDILSSDDAVLRSVFVHYLPPLELFRLPSNLWIRIRNDMHKYLVEKDIDNVPCIYFYHRSLQHYSPMDVRQLIIDNEEKVALERNRLVYFANQYSSTFDMSYSSKLMKKYNLPSATIAINRCLIPQKPLQSPETHRYNLRRIHQLLINIARYDFAHRFTLFDPEFLSAYLLCGEFSMGNLLYEFSIGALDPEGELRFLLKQLETCSAILDSHPNNLWFELNYRLLAFADRLPEATHRLLVKSVSRCPLQLLTDSERSQSLVEHRLASSITCLAIAAHYLFVLTADDQLHLFGYGYYQLRNIGTFDVNYRKRGGKERLVTFLSKYPYVCCLSSNGSMVVFNCDQKRVTMQTRCVKLVSFIGNSHILITASSYDALEIWDCAENALAASYGFINDAIENCTYQHPFAQVTLRRGAAIATLLISPEYQFSPTRTEHDHRVGPYDRCLFLDQYSELHYSLKHSTAYLLVYSDDTGEVATTAIDFGASPTSVVYLANSKSVAWLTTTSLMVLHPLHSEKIYKPFRLRSAGEAIEYDVVHDHSYTEEFRDQSNFLLASNRASGLIDIFEWRYADEEQKHQYRHLTRLQLDITFDQCVFTAGWFDGLTIYCSSKNTVYKYNATMMNFFTAAKPSVPSIPIHRTPIVHRDRFLTFTDHDHHLKLYTLNNRGTLEFHLSAHAVRQYHFAQHSPHILIVTLKNIVSVYSLNSAKLLWTTHEFEHRKLLVQPLSSSFVLICLQTKQLFHVDTRSFEIKALKPLPTECLLTTVASEHLLYGLANDQRSLLELNLSNQNLRVIALPDFSSSPVRQMHSIGDCIVFHTDDDLVYLWRNETTPISKLGSTSRWIVRGSQLILVDTKQRMIVLYDLNVKTSRTVRLDADVGECEALDLHTGRTESEQHLFVIGHDRCLRMYRVSDGVQRAKLFIHKDIRPFIGVLHDLLVLQVADRLCLIKILDPHSVPASASTTICSLFQQSMWMGCHHDHRGWLDASAQR